MKSFYRREILDHNKEDDCWIIVRNSVYDITGFISRHPGGVGILIARAGEDATSYFVTKHSKNKFVFDQLEKMKVGEIIESERIAADDFNEPFLMELIDQCYIKKLYNIPIWYKNYLFWIRLVNICMFFALSFFGLYSRSSPFFVIMAILLQAMIGTSLFGLIAHEDTHRIITNNKLFNLILSVFWPLFWPFISRGPLKYEHNSHHIKIGDPEYDYEVAAFAPFMRYSGYIEYSPIHQYQHKFAKYFYPFYANIITTIGGIRSGFWKKHNRRVGFEHSVSVIITLIYFIVIPVIIKGNWLWYLFLYLIYQCTLFYGIYVGAAINHFMPSASDPIPHEHKNKYGYYICHNTTDFCLSSKFWFWYTGGFNVQIEHHLIPFVPVENLRKMTPIVQQLCKKYDYPYNSYNSFLQLWNDHYKYLFMMSVETGSSVIENDIMNKKSYQGR